MAISRALAAALRWGREEIDELTDDFLDHKVFTYVEVLHELLVEHGGDVEREDIDLSDSILRALRAEAREHAQSVVSTYNSDLDAFVQRNGHLPRETFLLTYEAWADSRADARAELVAITEAYTAAADATMAFYGLNAETAGFEFGGHGDDDPQCDVCQVLEQGNPHPYERVVEVGNPHPQCRQQWRPVRARLGDELRIPDEPAGIVGREAWVKRFGDRAEAVEALGELVATSQ
jgi:hypothetical protein